VTHSPKFFFIWQQKLRQNSPSSVPIDFLRFELPAEFIFDSALKALSLCLQGIYI